MSNTPKTPADAPADAVVEVVAAPAVVAIPETVVDVNTQFVKVDNTDEPVAEQADLGKFKVRKDKLLGLTVVDYL